jgi:uncharacterized protein YbaP (TraB family)
LWEIRTQSGAVSHLFGTIHIEDPRVLDLPAPVATAFRESRRFVGELALDADAFARIDELMHLPEGAGLDTLLGADLYARTARALQGHVSDPAEIRRLTPWAAVMFLNMPPPKTGLVLDVVLTMQARHAGKEIVGLESVEEQIGIFARLPPADQRLLLEETLAHGEEIREMLAALVELWLDRDLAGLAEVSRRGLEAGDQRLMQEVERRLIVDRNRLMFERLQPLLAEGSAFIGVGALHLPGGQGLLQFLEDAGYAVRRIY